MRASLHRPTDVDSHLNKITVRQILAAKIAHPNIIQYLYNSSYWRALNIANESVEEISTSTQS